MKSEKFKFSVQEYNEAVKIKDFEKAFAINRKLYEVVLSDYHQFLDWKKRENELKLSDKSLRDLDTGLRNSLEILDELSKKGTALAYHAPQELNGLEGEQQ